jgi:hypothetical protein
MSDDPYLYSVRPILPCIVLDQNCFRDQRVVSKAILRAKNNNELIVITETALKEMMKSKKWESYYELSLKGLKEFPESVVGARSIGEMLEVEERDGIPQRNIVDNFLTSILRQHLVDLRAGPDRIMEMNKIFAERMQNMKFNASFYELNKKVLMMMVKNANDNLPPELVKKFRQRDRKALIDFLSSDAVTAICIDSIKDRGCPQNVAQMLALEPSVSSYYFLTTLGLMLKWVFFGGIETIEAERLSNDSLDMEYIAISFFCKELVSKDQKMMWIYSVLKDVVDFRWLTEKARLKSLGFI